MLFFQWTYMRIFFCAMSSAWPLSCCVNRSAFRASSCPEQVRRTFERSTSARDWLSVWFCYLAVVSSSSRSSKRSVRRLISDWGHLTFSAIYNTPLWNSGTTSLSEASSFLTQSPHHLSHPSIDGASPPVAFRMVTAISVLHVSLLRKFDERLVYPQYATHCRHHRIDVVLATLLENRISIAGAIQFRFATRDHNVFSPRGSNATWS